MSRRVRINVERDGEQLQLIGTGKVPVKGLTRAEELVILAREGHETGDEEHAEDVTKDKEK